MSVSVQAHYRSIVFSCSLSVYLNSKKGWAGDRECTSTEVRPGSIQRGLFCCCFFFFDGISFLPSFLLLLLLPFQRRSSKSATLRCETETLHSRQRIYSAVLRLLFTICLCCCFSSHETASQTARQ